MVLVKQGVIRNNEPYIEPPYHPSQTLDIFVQNSSPDAPWLIYIHGGAWRDPKVTKSTAHPLLRQQLLLNPFLNAATINYRLSPHPDFPSEDNYAVHPDHLNDVFSALLYLKSSYGLAEGQYILIGHSAGATLAFQALYMLYDQSLFPFAIIGIEGIYDLVDLVDEYPDYAGFISGAFGEEKEVWKSASPTWIGRELAGYADYKGKIVLIQSDDDELLSWRQTRNFKEVVDATGINTLVVRARGKHDEVPKGRELADVVSGLVIGLMSKGRNVQRAPVPQPRYVVSRERAGKNNTLDRHAPMGVDSSF